MIRKTPPLALWSGIEQGNQWVFGQMQVEPPGIEFQVVVAGLGENPPIPMIAPGVQSVQPVAIEKDGVVTYWMGDVPMVPQRLYMWIEIGFEQPGPYVITIPEMAIVSSQGASLGTLPETTLVFSNATA